MNSISSDQDQVSLSLSRAEMIRASQVKSSKPKLSKVEAKLHLVESRKDHIDLSWGRPTCSQVGLGAS